MTKSGYRAHSRLANLYKMMERSAAALDRVAALIAGVAMFAILAAALAQIAARHLLGQPINGVIDVTSQLLMPLAIMFGLTVEERDRGHIRIVLLFERFSPRVQRSLEVLGYLLTACFFGVVVYATSDSAYSAYTRGVETSGQLQIPLYLALLIVPIASILLIWRLLTHAMASALALAGVDGEDPA